MASSNFLFYRTPRAEKIALSFHNEPGKLVRTPKFLVGSIKGDALQIKGNTVAGCHIEYEYNWQVDFNCLMTNGSEEGVCTVVDAFSGPELSCLSELL